MFNTIQCIICLTLWCADCVPDYRCVWYTTYYCYSIHYDC